MEKEKYYLCRSLIFRFVNHMRNIVASRDKHRLHTQSLPQIKVMEIIFEHSDKGAMLKDVANELGLTPGAVSQTVETLVQSKFIERLEDADDRRAVRLFPSTSAIALRDRIDGIFSQIFNPIFDEVSEEDREAFLRVLMFLNSRIKEV